MAELLTGQVLFPGTDRILGDYVNCDVSTVRACDVSTVRACDVSTVRACDVSTVWACGFA